jgi:DNA polymerase
MRCNKCPLYKHAKNVLVPGRGSKTPTVMVVGIAPGYQENRDGKCFIGKAGQKLKEMLGDAGIPDDEVRFSNLVRCVPWKNPKDKGKVRDPVEEEIEACHQYLLDEITKYSPKVIIPLGKVPTFFFVPPLGPKLKITKHRGTAYTWAHPDTDVEYTIIPTLHPAAVCRNQNWQDKVTEDLVYSYDVSKGRSKDVFD